MQKLESQLHLISPGFSYLFCTNTNDMSRTLLIWLLSSMILACQPSPPAMAEVVSETYFLPLGGEPQYIEVHQTQANHPVLLLIHGGPAWPQTPQARAFNLDLAQRYTLVLWDQRGAGRSFLENPRPENITLAQIVADGHELVQHLKEKFDQDEIILAGYSWGSIVGLRLAEAYPEDVRAYIGIAQIIDAKERRKISQSWLREQVESTDTAALATLDSLEQGLLPMKMWAICASISWCMPTAVRCTAPIWNPRSRRPWPPRIMKATTGWMPTTTPSSFFAKT
ncbi:MAG: alpha/beta hydrolase [Bacteroidetes bacterium]|nr:MAG: alpha/beta hydrolase [Bacteroidota bacterium]